jgi:hypothetical protein
MTTTVIVSTRVNPRLRGLDLGAIDVALKQEECHRCPFGELRGARAVALESRSRSTIEVKISPGKRAVFGETTRHVFSSQPGPRGRPGYRSIPR